MADSMICLPTDHDTSRGVAFVSISWSFHGTLTAIIIIRLYTRLSLTRSAGSDDAMIFGAWLVSMVGTSLDTVTYKAGYGRHCYFLTHDQLTETMKWMFILWEIAYLSFFFVRGSVMFFTLRLLPRTKRKSIWTIYVAFALNLAITLLGTISFGVSCRPFSAHWRGGNCSSKEILMITNQVNGVLACIIDITTASIPALLLRGIQMKTSTKRVLSFFFYLGLLTAALSIARAVALTEYDLTHDFTYKAFPADILKLVETKGGTALACGPAVRQFFSYWSRQGTILPTANRAPPNSDFKSMRRRVNERDYYSQAKQDPMREQALINQQKRKQGSDLDSTDGRFGITDPEDSPLSECQERVAKGLSQV